MTNFQFNLSFVSLGLRNSLFLILNLQWSAFLQLKLAATFKATLIRTYAGVLIREAPLMCRDFWSRQTFSVDVYDRLMTRN